MHSGECQEKPPVMQVIMCARPEMCNTAKHRCQWCMWLHVAYMWQPLSCVRMYQDSRLFLIMLSSQESDLQDGAEMAACLACTFLVHGTNTIIMP